ncbi:MAG: hypothetical protein HDQ88_11700 [Clostridia bacterium]|nr:hypothetical protein [Clostridia bacterium]
MNKDNLLHIRLTDKEYELIRRTALKFGMTMSKFILSVLVPYCLKNGDSADIKQLVSNTVYFNGEIYMKL